MSGTEQPAPAIILSVQPERGFGAEAVLEELLSGWNIDAHPLQVIAVPRSRVYEAANDNRIPVQAWTASRDSILPNFKAARAIRHHLPPARLVHAWTSRGFESALYLARSLNAPAFGTMHDHAAASFHGTARRRIMRAAANRFSALACVSKPVAEVCRTHGYTCDLPVIHNGLRDLPLPNRRTDGPIRIGFLGMYAAWKGFDLVAPWIAELPDAQWQLYGEVHPSVQPLVDTLSANNYRLCGRQPTEEIFTEIDVLVHASSQFDPLPTVLLEAARAGIPVIAANIGGSSEIVLEGETGFRFDPSDPASGLEALKGLAADSAQRLRMGQAARQRYEQAFRIPQMVDHYAKLWGYTS